MRLLPAFLKKCHNKYWKMRSFCRIIFCAFFMQKKKKKKQNNIPTTSKRWLWSGLIIIFFFLFFCFKKNFYVACICLPSTLGNKWLRWSYNLSQNVNYFHNDQVECMNISWHKIMYSTPPPALDTWLGLSLRTYNVQCVAYLFRS